MLLFATALWWTTVSSPPDARPRCTMMREWTRPKNPPVLVLRASPDSALDGFYVTAARGPRREKPVPGEWSRPVYGQIFDVLSIEGPDAPAIANAKRVIVIWWSLSFQCSRDFPDKALRVPAGDAFVLSRVRPTGEWIDGIPTFDVGSAAWLYIPGEYRVATPNRSAMTMAEYRQFFPLIPTSDSTMEGTPNAWQRMFNWADANPSQAAKFPAAETLCTMRVFAKLDRSCVDKR